jgi:hypothetical protein
MNTGAGRHGRALERPRGRRVRAYAIVLVLAAGTAAAGAGLLGARPNANHCTVSATLVPSCGAWPRPLAAIAHNR